MATYLIDPVHSSVNFSIRHLMIANVRGVFEKFSGKMVYDPAKPEATAVEATIETASINTHMADRDKHLRGADFFDAEKFPTLTFKSTGAQRAGAGKLKVSGNLTMRGVTKPVVLEVDGPTAEAKDPYGNQKIGMSAETKIDRRDFGVAWNAKLEAGGFLIGDDVRISLDLQFARQAG